MASGAAFTGGASQPATERLQAHDGPWDIEEFMRYSHEEFSAALTGGASQPVTEHLQAHDGKWHTFEEFVGYSHEDLSAALTGGASQPATEHRGAQDGQWYTDDEVMQHYNDWAHWGRADKEAGRNTAALAVQEGSVNAVGRGQKRKLTSCTAHGKVDEIQAGRHVVAPSAQPAAASAAPHAVGSTTPTADGRTRFGSRDTF